MQTTLIKMVVTLVTLSVFVFLGFFTVNPVLAFFPGWNQDTSKTSLNEAERREILRIHHALRRQTAPTAANMIFLVWNEALEDVAQDYSTRCDFTHNYANAYGENLAVISTFYNVTDSVEGWFSEGENFDFNTLDCSGATCGHYHQVVLAESRAIGCGMTFCPSMSTVTMSNAYFLVCNYDPAENKGSSQPYESGVHCSNCPAAYPTCDNGLCRSDPICDNRTCHNGGQLVNDVCRCDCAAGFEGPSCEDAITVCDGLTCENGGQLNSDNCTCSCESTGFHGATCEDPDASAQSPTGSTENNQFSNNTVAGNHSSTAYRLVSWPLYGIILIAGLFCRTAG